MPDVKLREKRTHGTHNFRFSMENVFSENRSSPFSPLHFHREFEFCVVSKGEMKVQINEEIISLKKGEGVFINSGTLHSILPKEKTDGQMIIMMFDSGFVSGEKDIIHTKYIVPLIKGEFSLPEKLSAEECRLILKANEIYTDTPFGFELEMKDLALRLLISIIRRPHFIDSKIPHKNIGIIKKTIEYIHENYASSITLSQMADCVFVSPEHLCRVFSHFSDTSPFEYLNRYRIIKSGELLLETNLSVSEIASACGFNSSSYFNKTFLRFMGCTPSQYKKSNDKY